MAGSLRQKTRSMKSLPVEAGKQKQLLLRFNKQAKSRRFQKGARF